MKYRATERYITGWTDPRALYEASPPWQIPRLSEQLITNLFGTFLLMVPIIAIAWWMGWL